MATLEALVGRPLHELSDEELEEIIMRGRLAREDESTGARGKRTAKPKKVKGCSLDDFGDDLDDFSLDGDLDD